MYIDLEGVNLYYKGSLSIFTLLIDISIPTIRVCLIDIYLLGSQAFNTSSIKGKTLKDILYNEKILKVFFDFCNNSDVLFAYFSVTL
jgi:exonuclease 3'-5' domain-containing protein 1